MFLAGKSARASRGPDVSKQQEEAGIAGAQWQRRELGDAEEGRPALAGPCRVWPGI